MTISKGDRLPSTTFTQMTENGPEAVSSDDYFAGKTVAIFSVPGAFTPTCSAKHLPGFIDKSEALKAKGHDARPVTGAAVGGYQGSLFTPDPRLPAPVFDRRAVTDDRPVNGVYRAGSDHRKDGQAVGW